MVIEACLYSWLLINRANAFNEWADTRSRSGGTHEFHVPLSAPFLFFFFFNRKVNAPAACVARIKCCVKLVTNERRWLCRREDTGMIKSYFCSTSCTIERFSRHRPVVIISRRVDWRNCRVTCATRFCSLRWSIDNKRDKRRRYEAINRADCKPNAEIHRTAEFIISQLKWASWDINVFAMRWQWSRMANRSVCFARRACSPKHLREGVRVVYVYIHTPCTLIIQGTFAVYAQAADRRVQWPNWVFAISRFLTEVQGTVLPIWATRVRCIHFDLAQLFVVDRQHLWFCKVLSEEAGEESENLARAGFIRAAYSPREICDELSSESGDSCDSEFWPRSALRHRKCEFVQFRILVFTPRLTMSVCISLSSADRNTTEAHTKNIYIFIYIYGVEKEKRRDSGIARGRRKKEKETEQSRKFLPPWRATISLRASNFYGETTRPGRGNTRGDEVVSTCNATIFVFFLRKVTR